MTLAALNIEIVFTTHEASSKQLAARDKDLENRLSHTQSQVLKSISGLAQTQASNHQQLMVHFREPQAVTSPRSRQKDEDMMLALQSLSQDGVKFLVSLLCLFRGLMLYEPGLMNASNYGFTDEGIALA